MELPARTYPPIASTENSTQVHPLFDAAAQVYIQELQDHYVTAVSVAADGNIAAISNRCGIAADWCIAANTAVLLGHFGPDENGKPSRWSSIDDTGGTSVAAAVVSGGLALTQQMFRGQLSNTELVARFYATADKEGRYADRAVYGQGLMDLDTALAPVGRTLITTGRRIDGPGRGLHATRLRTGPALGDALPPALAGRELAAFDELGAPFWYDAAGFAAMAAGSPAAARLQGLMARNAAPQPEGSGFGFHPRDLPVAGWAAGNGLLDLSGLSGGAAVLRFGAGGGLTAVAVTTAGMPGEAAPETGAVLSWRPAETPLDQRAGLLAEPEAMLGSTADGAFGRLSVRSAALGVGAETHLAGWRFKADAELDLVSPRADGGLVADMSGLSTSAFTLRAGRRLESGDRVALLLSQPVRVERGRARLVLPAGRTRTGEVLHEAVPVRLAPSGRQIGLAAQWSRTAPAGGELRAEASLSHEPRQRAGARPEIRLLAG